MLLSDIKSRLKPSKDQKWIIIILILYTLIIMFLWNFKPLSWLLWPFKIMTVTMHELSHAFVAICTKASVKKIIIKSNEGGKTVYVGGNPLLIIPAGYIGSTIIGSILIFSGFRQSISKIASIFLVLCMCCTLFYSEGFFTFAFTILVIISIVSLWYYKKWKGIQYFVLFIGVMSGLYSLWDIIADLVTRKIDTSDASKYAQLVCCSPQFWGLIWLGFSLICVIFSIVLALLVYNKGGNDRHHESGGEIWELMEEEEAEEDDNFGFSQV